MAKMQVEGKVPVEVPRHLSGAVAAGNEKRIVAHVIDAGIVVAIYLLFMILPTMGISNAANFDALESALSTAATMWTLGMLALIALGIAQLALILTKGQTIAMNITGLRWVSFLDGNINGGSAFGKTLLEGVINSVSFGLATPIIWLVSQDNMNRHWFARTTNLITINIKDGRDTAFVPPRLESDEPETDANQPWSPTSGTPRPMITDNIPSPPVLPSTPATPPVGTPNSSSASAPITEVPGISSSPTPSALTPPAPANPYAPPVEAHTPPAPTGMPSAYQPPAPTGMTHTPPAPEAPSPYAPPAATAAVTPPSLPTHPFGTPQPSITPSVQADPFTAPQTPVEEVDRTVARRPVDSILLTFDDGSHHFLSGQALVGRAPEPEPGHPNAQMVSLHDPGRSISKIHIALSVQSGAVLVEDMHSTNGTTVMLPSGTTQAVLPGAPVLAPAGATVYFGDRSVKIGG